VQDDPTNSICLNGERFIPVEIVDCAGLIPGSHKGRGLGNEFLDEIRRADSLIQIVDASGSTDAEGNYCKPGTGDPIEEVKFLEQEVVMWFTQILRRGWQRTVKLVEVGRKSLSRVLRDELSGLNIREERITRALDEVGLDPDKPSTWSSEDLFSFAKELWKISKPLLIAANKMDLPFAEENLQRLKELGYPVIPCCAEAELMLRRATEAELIKYTPGDSDFELVEGSKLTEEQRRALELVRREVLSRFNSTGVQQSINAALFDLLNMITVYPVRDSERLCDHDGRVLPEAYLIPSGTTARQLAYKVHNELGEFFLYAIDVRKKRKVGEDFILQDKDVIKIVSAKMRG
jgi:hypothetical protein